MSQIFLPLLITIEQRIKNKFKFIFLEAVFVQKVTSSSGAVISRLEYGVNCCPEHVLYHFRDDSFYYRRIELKTRVGVDFNKPWSEIFIDDEIKAEHLKAKDLRFGINSVVDSFNSQSGYLFHLLIQLLHRIIILLAIGIQIVLKLTKRYLIASLVLTIIVTFDLNCIISEMYEEIRKLLWIEYLWTCSYISFTVPVVFWYSTYWNQKHICSDLEFSFLI